MNKITWWFDLPTESVLNLRNQEFKPLALEQIKEYPCRVNCNSEAFVWLQFQGYPKEKDGWSIKVGKATFKWIRGATKENPEGLGTQALKKVFELHPEFTENHPSHPKEIFKALTDWVYPPRYENLKHFAFTDKEGVFEQVWKIDLKACYAQIMKNYPLPYGEPIHLKNSLEIVKALAEGKTGFVRFILNNPARIKNQQIPFIPNAKNEIKAKVRGRLVLSTKLFKVFKKQYKVIGKIKFTNFWIFEEKKGDVDKFLAHCSALRNNPDENIQASGKQLVNSLWGAIGKEKFGGYNYRAWTVAVSHLAILQTYYLYRQFKPENILAIRSDCVYVTGNLPAALNPEIYHLELLKKIKIWGEESLAYVNSKNELKLKSFISGKAREELLEKLKQIV